MRDSGERAAPGSRPTITKNAERDDNLWALDLGPLRPGGPEYPLSAHLIVAIHQEPHRGEVRTAACGREFTCGTHPRGWRRTNGHNLPLQDHAIHCGADRIAGVEDIRPDIGHPTTADRAMVARATGGGIHSRELTPQYEEDNDMPGSPVEDIRPAETET